MDSQETIIVVDSPKGSEWCSRELITRAPVGQLICESFVPGANYKVELRWDLPTQVGGHLAWKGRYF